QDKDAGLWAVRGGADSRGGMISVRENHFTADGSGVVAGNVGLLVERNEFANARDAAIHLIGAGAVIRGNRIQGGATMGIVAENAGEAVIDSNELEQFATYAIMVRGSGNALVRANRIHNCGYGLAFVLGDPRRPSSAVGNTIIEPKFNGIDVLGDSPILRHNQVLRPHAFALHVLDYTWLLTIFAVLLAIALPWFVSGLHIDFAATAAGLLALAAVHVVLAAISGVRPSGQSRGTLGLSSLHALGVAAVAFIWHHAGGLQNPLFLA